MSKEKENDNIGCALYVIAGLSFIPLIGVLFGIITIVFGIVKFNQGGKKLLFLGIAGIMITVILYGGLYYFGFVKRGGVYDESRKKLAKDQLTKLVQTIEYYKVQYDEYPSSLKELKNKLSNKNLFIKDIMAVNSEKEEVRLYYYKLLKNGKSYYLFSLGIDGIPFTKDDILPDISKNEMDKIGYKDRPLK